ncbi:MAG TPA: zinc ribbon domain-containing protein [Blastocatellia bacterium]|nr:zinc ribbon domain-containing protein [Blastocatellia bacterium]
MFCPKCSTESNDSQKFCKACGTNLQLVSDALGKGADSLGQLRIDVESLNRKAADFAKSLKPEWENFWKTNGPGHAGGPIKIRPNEPTKQEPPHKRLPRNWLSYSWQHSLKGGLVSLLAGAGTAAMFFYFGRAAIDSGAIADLEILTRVRGLGQIAALLWLLGLVPALKGLGQIFYAAFFAPSIFKLAQQLLPPPSATLDLPSPDYSAINEAPASVTEHTTQFFGESKPGVEAHNQGI